MNVKDNFHHLNDSIEDEELLKSYYHLNQKINEERNGSLWNALSQNEKKELLASYEESFDSKNILTDEQVKHQHAEWLKP